MPEKANEEEKRKGRLEGRRGGAVNLRSRETYRKERKGERTGRSEGCGGGEEGRREYGRKGYRE